MERLRPRSLEPFDFEGPAFSDDLWFAEGFTNYYARAFLHRSGLMSDAQYVEDVNKMLSRLTLSPLRDIPATRIEEDFFKDRRG